MPYYRAPRSDLKRQLFLQRAACTGAEDLAAGQAYLSADSVAELAALAEQFTQAYHRLGVLMTARMAEVVAAGPELSCLQHCLRDMWSGLRRRVRRQCQPVRVLGFYQLPVEGRLPNPGARDAWIALAEAAVAGDLLAVAAGFPALSNPGIDELQAALSALKARVIAIANADRAYQQAQAAVAALRPQVDLCIKAVMRELHWKLVAEDQPGFRRIARRYGAEFNPYPGELEETDLVLDAGTPLENPQGANLISPTDQFPEERGASAITSASSHRIDDNREACLPDCPDPQL